ncbi:MAG: hypothetical protein ACRYF4_04085 [Janthinobacterium lividum]
MSKKINPRIKELIQQLGEAIHESVSESDQISGVVREIREEGFDVLLMLEATIGLNEVTAESEETDEEETGEPFTRNDVSFLKSLRISLPDEAPENTDSKPDEAAS